MVMKLDGIWPKVAGSILPSLSGVDPGESIERGIDPAMADAASERKRRRQAEQFAHDRDDREKQRDAEREDSDMDAAFMESWLASEEYRRAYKELTDSLADAHQAALRAYERALEEREKAHQALEEARRNAITLSDGRRVYFTKDGQRLYTEDNHEITDGVTLAEARSRREAQPDATAYEDFAEKRANDKASVRAVEAAENFLHRVDDLQTRIKDGQLSPAELKQAQEELQQITGEMTPEMRTDYESLRAQRQGQVTVASRTPEAALESVGADAFRLRTADPGPQIGQETGRPETSRPPVTRVVPDFGQ